MFYIFAIIFFISSICVPAFIVYALVNLIRKRPVKKFFKLSGISFLVAFASMIGAVITVDAPPVVPIESIELAISDQQDEYDINTDIPVEITILPEDADTSKIKYLSDGESLSFSETGVTTGAEEGTYDIYVEAGNITSNKLSITVTDIAAKEAEEKRIAEEKAAKEAEERRIAEEKAAKEAEEKRIAEEKAAKEAEEKRFAEEKAAKEAEEKRIAEEKAAKEAEQKAVQEASAQTTPSAPKAPSSSGGSSGSGNGSNFDTYDNPEQQQTSDSFVLNTSSHKIHYPSCRDVKKISPENYSTSSLTVDELKAQGYTTCGHCF